jgi:hypothetical protein
MLAPIIVSIRALHTMARVTIAALMIVQISRDLSIDSKDSNTWRTLVDVTIVTSN